MGLLFSDDLINPEYIFCANEKLQNNNKYISARFLFIF